MGKYCEICGNSSGFYPLCKECADKYKEGLIDRDEYGNWYEIDEDDEEYNQIEYQNESGSCIVCGEDAPYGKQCRDCYYETLEYQDEIDKNRKAYELREWYYNLKDKIYRLNDFEEIQTNCNKLIALALLLRNIHGDNSTINRVYNDIKDLITRKQKINCIKEQELNIDNEKNYTAGQSRALDGHWLDNDFERDIDDMLYNLRIVHVYAKKVNEITERTVKCDWFIPVISNSKGIYIEFWGKSSPDYIKNKQEKIRLYKEYELELIEINKDEMVDKQLVQDRLETEINKIKKEMTKKYR